MLDENIKCMQVAHASTKLLFRFYIASNLDYNTHTPHYTHAHMHALINTKNTHHTMNRISLLNSPCTLYAIYQLVTTALWSLIMICHQ